MQKLCLARSCEHEEQQGCEECMREFHVHAKGHGVPKCEAHGQPMDKFCFAQDCDAPEEQGCQQCMNEQHCHQPLETCREHKEKIARLCMSNCEYPVAFGCHSCMNRYHNHKKQLILDINYFFKEYNYVVHLGSLQDEVAEEKARFKGFLGNFVLELKAILTQKLDRAQDRVSRLITNYFMYEHEPEFGEVMNTIANGHLAMLNPKDVHLLYKSMLKKRTQNFTLNEVKKHCEYIVIMEGAVREVEANYRKFAKSQMFVEFGGKDDSSRCLEPLMRYIANEE
jgi:hypothetical protein